ncbi:MAG: leucine-rich repeat domain-containing protein [Polyangiales bacterium]
MQPSSRQPDERLPNPNVEEEELSSYSGPWEFVDGPLGDRFLLPTAPGDHPVFQDGAARLDGRLVYLDLSLESGRNQLDRVSGPLTVTLPNDALLVDDLVPMLQEVDEHHIVGAYVSAVALPRVSAMPALQMLDARDERVTNAELEHLSTLANLRVLYLGSTQVTDAGLVHLAGLTQLQRLDLRLTPVADAGLAHLAGLTQLELLDLRYTQVTDIGLRHLSTLTQLRMLYLGHTRITNAGLAHLSSLQELLVLRLQGTQISDAGLVHLSRLRELLVLDLSDTRVTDAGLPQLVGMTQLQTLYLGAHVTDAGISALQGARPELDILR